MFNPLKKLVLIATVLLFSNPSFADNPKVSLETSMGAITLTLFSQEAPASVENFLRYVDEGFYVGTQFHRVISGFMIQGGGFTEDMVQKKNHDPIKNESANGLANKQGTISMARTQDPDSATSQFFINLVDNNSLNQMGNRPGYSVFGEVTQGMDIVNAIGKVNTTTRARHRDVPVQPILILSTKRL
ncbi:peptidylprolyl isomerase [Neptunomonas sp.]|uniref:peptidylprolyl isomerase n=1 Tax=Neptunomonas sp. TaxID=1971898 RepID=UPI00356563CA